MLQQVRRGWTIATAGWAVLARHPKLLLFPLGTTFFIAAALVAVVPPALELDATLELGPPLFFTFVLLPLAAVVGYFVVLGLAFCNAALTCCALRAFDGAQPSILAGLAAAGRRLPQLALWALSEMTVGFLVKAGQRPTNNVDMLAFILALFVSGAVGDRYFPRVAGNFFVLPLLADEHLSLAEARKRSAVLVRLHWGEKADRAPRFGYLAVALGTAAGLLWIVALFALAFFRISAGVESFFALLLVLLAGGVLLSALGAVFTAAVYRLALSGNPPAPYSDELLRSALERDCL